MDTVVPRIIGLRIIFTEIFANVQLFVRNPTKRSGYCNRISSVGRALDCRAGGSQLDSRDRTNTQGLKMTEK